MEKTYLHQFIWRRKNADLPVDVMRKLAALLDLPFSAMAAEFAKGVASPAQLSRPTMLPPPATAAAFRTTAPPVRNGAPLVPHFSDVDLIAPPGGIWTGMVGTLAIHDVVFSLAITQPRGRLRADRLLVGSGQARVGDMVVVLRGQRVAAVGELCSLSHESATVSTSDMQHNLPPETYRRADVQLMKVAAAEFA